jgi:hypothetical protein
MANGPLAVISCPGRVEVEACAAPRPRPLPRPLVPSLGPRVPKASWKVFRNAKLDIIRPSFDKCYLLRIYLFYRGFCCWSVEVDVSLGHEIGFISRITHSALTFLGCNTGLNFIFGFGGPAAPAFPSPAGAAPVLGPAAALAAVELPGGAGLANLLLWVAC